MESLTKPVVTPETLDRIARKHLGEASVSVRELKDGWFNAAFLLTQPDGAEFVLKIAPSPAIPVLRYEKDIMAAEVEAMRLVAERTSLPIPRIEAYDTTRLEAESDYFLMERLHGVPFDSVRKALDEDVQRSFERQIGASLHSFEFGDGPGYGLFGSPRFTSWQEAFKSLLEDLRQDAIDRAVELPEGVFEVAERHFWSLDSVARPVFLHWDLWDGNVFVDVEAGQITGFIDFERALWGDPLMESNFRETRPGLLDGYGSDPFKLEGARERRYLYDLHLMLIMVIECKFRGYAADHEAWPRVQLTALAEAGGPAIH